VKSATFEKWFNGLRDRQAQARVYFQQRGAAIALLLCAGDKSTQDADIRRAIQIAKDWKR